MSMGLKFAGSANKQAFNTLLMYAKKFTSLLGKSIAELAGKSTIETSLNVIVLSLAMVNNYFYFLLFKKKSRAVVFKTEKKNVIFFLT